jgi:hypothetical protein
VLCLRAVAIALWLLLVLSPAWPGRAQNVCSGPGKTPSATSVA